MSNAIRILEPNVVYSVVQTIVDRTFAFAPNHDPAQPLLARGCPAEALDPRSPIVPVPSVINIVGAAAARALELAPVNLHALELSTTHEHAEVSAKGGNIAEIPAFLRDFHAKVARDLNRLLEREGHLYAGPSRVTPCGNDDHALDQLIYALTNVVQDGLVDRVRNSPFFSTYGAQAHGKPLRFWDIEWEKYHAAGGVANKQLSPKRFFTWRTLEIAPLPHLAGMPEHQRQTLIRKTVEAVEEKTADQLEREGRKAFPVSRHFEIDPRDRPKTPRKSGRKPIVHASTPAERDAYREKRREVMKLYVPASIAFRQGNFDVEFPPGTFRPPLIRPIPNSS